MTVRLVDERKITALMMQTQPRERECFRWHVERFLAGEPNAIGDKWSREQYDAFFQSGEWMTQAAWRRVKANYREQGYSADFDPAA